MERLLQLEEERDGLAARVRQLVAQAELDMQAIALLRDDVSFYERVAKALGEELQVDVSRHADW
jgi:hypothetical protein